MEEEKRKTESTQPDTKPAPDTETKQPEPEKSPAGEPAAEPEVSSAENVKENVKNSAQPAANKAAEWTTKETLAKIKKRVQKKAAEKSARETAEKTIAAAAEEMEAQGLSFAEEEKEQIVQQTMDKVGGRLYKMWMYTVEWFKKYWSVVLVAFAGLVVCVCIVKWDAAQTTETQPPETQAPGAQSSAEKVPQTMDGYLLEAERLYAEMQYDGLNGNKEAYQQKADQFEQTAPALKQTLDQIAQEKLMAHQLAGAELAPEAQAPPNDAAGVLDILLFLLGVGLAVFFMRHIKRKVQEKKLPDRVNEYLQSFYEYYNGIDWDYQGWKDKTVKVLNKEPYQSVSGKIKDLEALQKDMHHAKNICAQMYSTGETVFLSVIVSVALTKIIDVMAQNLNGIESAITLVACPAFLVLGFFILDIAKENARESTFYEYMDELLDEEIKKLKK